MPLKSRNAWTAVAADVTRLVTVANALAVICSCGPSVPGVLLLSENRYAVETPMHASQLARATASAEQFCANRNLGLVRDRIEPGQTLVNRRGRAVTTPSLMHFSCAGERTYYATLPPGVEISEGAFGRWMSHPAAAARSLVANSPGIRRFCEQHEGRPNVVVRRTDRQSDSRTWVAFACEGEMPAPATPPAGN